MTQFKIYNGNCLDVLRNAPDNFVDSIVCDPPYGLAFMGKKWDYDVPSTEIWKECHRVLKPGGHLLAFGGTRTYHRLVVAIEDAGFEIRDQIQWIYGQGFPKSQDISKAIDKAAGAEREVVGVGRGVGVKAGQQGYSRDSEGSSGGKYNHEYEITKAATPDAQKWSGWGTALKPANEPICLARKPLSESTIAKNVLKHGTGGLNIDATRIDFASEADKASTLAIQSLRKGQGSGGLRFHLDKLYSLREQGITKTEDGRDLETAITYAEKNRELEFEPAAGRFPSNVIFDEAAAGVLDAQAAQSVSRFFYQAKASKSDRGEGNIHPTVKPIKLMEYLIKLVTPEGGVVLDPFMGSGTTGVAAVRTGFQFRGIELDEKYFYIAQARLEKETKDA